MGDLAKIVDVNIQGEMLELKGVWPMFGMYSSTLIRPSFHLNPPGSGKYLDCLSTSWPET